MVADAPTTCVLDAWTMQLWIRTLYHHCEKSFFIWFLLCLIYSNEVAALAYGCAVKRQASSVAGLAENKMGKSEPVIEYLAFQELSRSGDTLCVSSTFLTLFTLIQLSSGKIFKMFRSRSEILSLDLNMFKFSVTYRYGSAGINCFAVCRSNSFEIRSAAWLLYW